VNICIVSRVIPTHSTGGMERHAWTLCERLSELGHAVFVVTSAHPKGKVYEEVGNVKIWYVSGTKPGSYTGFFTAAARQIEEIDRGVGLDVVHSESIAAKEYLAYPFRKPVVCSIHGTYLSESSLSRTYLKQHHWLYRLGIILKNINIVINQFRLMKPVVEQADGLIAGSNYTRQQFTRLSRTAAQKIGVIPHGIDLDKFKVRDRDEARRRLSRILEIDSASKVILLVSRLTKTKGMQIAIRAYELLIHSIKGCSSPSVWLVIVGDGPYRRQLEGYASKKRIPNIVFLGELPEELLPVAYNAADIFVNPDLTEPAFGLVCVEAMACGMPVIASKSGAIPEIVDDSVGRLFTPGDSRSLAREMSELLQDDGRRAIMGAQAAQKARAYFDERRMVEQILAFYERVISNQREGVR